MVSETRKTRRTVASPDIRVKVYNPTTGEMLEGPWGSMLSANFIGRYLADGEKFWVDVIRDA